MPSFFAVIRHLGLIRNPRYFQVIHRPGPLSLQQLSLSDSDSFSFSDSLSPLQFWLFADVLLSVCLPFADVLLAFCLALTFLFSRISKYLALLSSIIFYRTPKFSLTASEIFNEIFFVQIKFTQRDNNLPGSRFKKLCTAAKNSAGYIANDLFFTIHDNFRIFIFRRHRAFIRKTSY